MYQHGCGEGEEGEEGAGPEDGCGVHMGGVREEHGLARKPDHRGREGEGLHQFDLGRQDAGVDLLLSFGLLLVEESG